MKVLSLSDLFYEISGITPKVSNAIRATALGTPNYLVPDLVSKVDPRLAEQRIRQFLKKENLTREDLQFDRDIPTHCRYEGESSPGGHDDYQELVWKDLLWARNTDGWGAGKKAKVAVAAIKRRVASDTSLFGIRSRLFCDMVMVSAGEENAQGTLDRLRTQGRRVTKAFLAQKDFLSAATSLLMESLLARTQALTDGNVKHQPFAMAATKAAQDLLIGRPKQYDRRLVNVVLFHTAAYGIGTAMSIDDRSQASVQQQLLDATWEDLADDNRLHDWLQLMRLRAQSGYYLFTDEDDKCAECLLRACSLYDQLDQNLPFLELVNRISQWAQRARCKGAWRELITVYITRWNRNPRLSYVTSLNQLLGYGNKLPLRQNQATTPHLIIGARAGMLSKEDGLLRL